MMGCGGGGMKTSSSYPARTMKTVGLITVRWVSPVLLCTT